MEPQFLLIVKQPRGLVIRDTPRPESQGGKALRTVAVGTALYAYSLHNLEGVQYARLVPQNPQKPEWVRVVEADGSVEYVDVIEMEETGEQASLVSAIRELADVLRSRPA